MFRGILDQMFTGCRRSMFYESPCPKQCFVGEHHFGPALADIFGSPSYASFHLGFREQRFQLRDTVLDFCLSYLASYRVNADVSVEWAEDDFVLRTRCGLLFHLFWQVVDFFAAAEYDKCGSSGWKHKKTAL